MAKKRVNWTRDEIILACEIVRRNDWNELGQDHADVIELSQLLQRNPEHPLGDRGADFRSPGSVSRKTTDIATRHPKYATKPTKLGEERKRTKGGKLDEKVLLEFLDNEGRMGSAASRIRQGILRGEFEGLAIQDEPDEEDYQPMEGRLLAAHHFKRERDPKLRKKKLESVERAGRPIACEACSFDFGQVYGVRGQGYIEVHHVRPLHDSGPVRTRLDDLALLCANCHRMIHRGRRWLTIDELMSCLSATDAKD